MNPYLTLGSGIGTSEAASLSTRLAAWHDVMVAHDRKIRAGRTDEVCDEECPHAEARRLWIEAREIFGSRAQELTFLRSRATSAREPSQKFVAARNVLSEAADRRRRSNISRHKSVASIARRSRVLADTSNDYGEAV